MDKLDSIVVWGQDKAKMAAELGDAIAKRLLELDRFPAHSSGELCATLGVDFTPAQVCG